MTYKKKLIEVALPLDDINKEAAREKSIRHGHPSTLHLWWARRPLAACRAVLFGQLVDDPSAHPEEFPTEEAQQAERERLFDIIRRLVPWEASNDEKVLEEARAEIRKSCGDNPPPILDPFAGGGSIPLEAQRLGLEAHASDLNPVAVLINKALIEIPPRWAGHPPVHPREGRLEEIQTWKGAQGLAEDVRYYGKWMRDEAERRIGHHYPEATLPDGSHATVIAWIWLAAAVAAARDGKASLDDPAFQLKVMWDHWNDVFGRVLGRAERTFVNELSATRNRWAHNEKFTFDDTYRALDSIERLLTAISAPQAEAVAKSKEEAGRAHYEAEAKKAAAPKEAAPVGAVKGLPAWREVVTPHDDVARGEFKQAEFAANLARVARGDGPPEYVDPVEFFRRTYLTAGLHNLLVDALRRVSGRSGDPVVNLQTSFGGGKTHSMLALWHLFSGVALAGLPEEVRALAVEAGVEALPTVRRVALVGTEIQPGEASVKDDGTVVATLWGELAWQLGGAEAFREIEAADRSGTSPGRALGLLLERYGPCLVLIDEWVAHARQLYSRDDLPAGTLDAQVTFAQALTEQAAAVDGTLVVVSIPASADGDAVSESISEVEVGGVGGREALRRLRSVVGRIDSPWSAATAEESFEIVRRRLFEPLTDPELLAQRDEVARAFTDYYRREQAEFPTECREAAYGRRIAAAYPVHPELFARLYEDWSTLERFQRTRGVLRLMAAVIHALWARQDAAPLILPASLPLDDAEVRGELAKYLPDAWKPIIDADIDGPDATSVQIDRAVPNLGRYAAARRAARAIFVGSAPRSDSAHRGVEAQRIRLGCAVPGESVATYGDALNRLSDRSAYLYVEGARYWYGLQQSITRLAQERAESWRLARRDELHQHVVERLRAERDRGEFAGVHVGPAGGSDVPDDPAVRLVVLGPDTPHVPRSEASPALAVAQELLERRGNAAREYRNMVVFAAADQRRLDELEQAAAEFLAWKSIDEEAEELNLDAQMRRQAATKRAQADDAVRLRLAEAYQWILVPGQPAPDGPVAWEAERAEGQGPLALRASRRLVAQGLLQNQLPPVLLRLQLDGPLASLWEDGAVEARKVWDCFARYLYLPRLRDFEVLLGAVTGGPAGIAWVSEGFALADGDDPASGRLVGLVAGSHPPRAATPSTLLVRPEVALGQMEQEAVEGGGGVAVGVGPGGGVGVGREEGAGEGGVGVVEVRPRRFHGSVRLDPTRPARDFDKVRAEVLDHLISLVGADVEVTVDIAATLEDGFPETTVRTVTENSRTLRFDPGSGFEET